MKAAQAPATPVQLRWLCACLALAIAPHLTSLPPWLIGVTAAFVVLRLALAARQRPPPPKLLRLALAAIALALLWLQYRTFNGLEAGTALLCLVAGLKFLETQSRRDLYVLTFIVYFLGLAALLRGESFWLLGYLVGVAWLTSATLLHLTPARPLEALPSARRAGRILAQALPIALVLWLLFPRFDGPLWQLSSEAHAQSGLSDILSPGDITELALSSEVAFRVHFLGATPPPGARYWRGPVLHQFDGRAWRGIDSSPARVSHLLLSGAAYRYRLSLEPHAHRWIFTLDWPASWSLPKALLTSDEVLMQPEPILDTLDVVASSFSEAHLARPLGADERARDTALPPASNPRTGELAQRLWQAHPRDVDYARAVLALFHDQPFYYTLTPPRLEQNPSDEFLFETRRGFCGHYASAFAHLMRAAGIPARVVTGYLGGTYNRFANYWIVRQSDAHAWTEVWLEGRGWTRIDPTSAVAPERVERGLNDTVAADEPLASRWQRHTPWLADLRLELDALHEWWRERILRYDSGLQLRLLKALHVPDPDAQKLVILLGISLGLALGWLTWQVRRETRPADVDPVQRAYARLCRKLAVVGLERRAFEGPLSFAARVGAARPDLKAVVQGLCDLYAGLRYGPPLERASVARSTFIAAVRAFHPPRRPLGAGAR
jgi:transglutaminase-like putative cysteine protease